MEIAEKLKKEKNAIFSEEIKYNNKKYIKAVKWIDNGIEYLYYEIIDGKLKEIENENVITYLRKIYETNEGKIIY